MRVMTSFGAPPPSTSTTHRGAKGAEGVWGAEGWEGAEGFEGVDVLFRLLCPQTHSARI